jgi:uncharacterized protein (TIGR03437 family)
MKRRLLTAAIVTLLALGPLFGTAAATAATAPRPSGTGDDSTRVESGPESHDITAATGGSVVALGGRAIGVRPHDWVPPLGAAAICPPSNLIYHSGAPVILSPKVVDIFWGPSFNDPSSSDYAYARDLIAYRDLYGGTPEFNVITQYYQNLGGGNQFIQLSNLAAGAADWFDTSTPPAAVSDGAVQAEVNAYLASHGADTSTIYEVFLPAASYSSNPNLGGTSCGGSPLAYCAYHNWYSNGGSVIKYSVQPYASCGQCQVGGWTADQNQEHFVAHETREAVTDPQLNAWFNSCGNEADDNCAWSPTPFLGSGGFGYQWEWSNAASSCVQTAGGFGSVGFVVNSASYAASVAPDAYGTAFGQNLASGTASGSGNPLPTSLGGVNATVGGIAARLSYVSAGQINLVVGAGAPTPSSQLVFIYNNGTLAATGAARLGSVAPGLFTANGTGSGQGSGQWQRYDSSGNLLASNDLSVPINFGAPTDQVYLILYGTGIRHVSSQAAVSVTVGGQAGQVTYASLQPSYDGLDQVNILLPHSLAGAGSGVPVVLTADGATANTVTVSIQ